MTSSQRRVAYRLAVEASLQTFYGKSRPVSESIVHAWWDRISRTSGFESGLFMHPEPIHTAADLLDVETIEITEENEATYLRLLERCRANATDSSKADNLLPEEEMQPATAGR